ELAKYFKEPAALTATSEYRVCLKAIDGVKLCESVLSSPSQVICIYSAGLERESRMWRILPVFESLAGTGKIKEARQIAQSAIKRYPHGITYSELIYYALN